jgi:hypothetical protein
MTKKNRVVREDQERRIISLNPLTGPQKMMKWMMKM